MIKATKRSRDIAFVSIPLLFGFIVYFSCRTKTLLYYRYIPFKEVLQVNALHARASEKCAELLGLGGMGDMIVFSLPAAMYAFSLTYYFKKRYYLTVAPSGSRSRSRVLVLWTFFVALLPELLQLFGILPGHFDLVDVLSASLAISIAMIL
jgi:hypothetical protein